MPAFSQSSRGLLVVSVQRLKRSLQFSRQAKWVERLALASSLLRHVTPDVLPQVPEFGHLRIRYVVRHWNARQFNDAALDRVHEREITHRPREERALSIAGTPSGRMA